MKNYKKFIIFFCIFLALTVTFHAVVWFLFTKKVMSNTIDQHVGDLSRLGYLVNYSQMKKNSFDLPKEHVSRYKPDDGSFDVVTLGDSFSQGGAGGKNRFYQDYLASIHGLRVLNLGEYRHYDFIDTANILAQSGFLNKLQVKFFILEVVERNAADELARNINFTQTAKVDNVEEFYKTKKTMEVFPKIGFINTGNMTFLWYSFLYNFSDRAVFSQTVIRDLRIPLFSGKNGNKLLFYTQDLAAVKKINPQRIKKINDNLNLLARVLREKGIKLYFMPVPDKYSLYSQYIVDNPYPKPALFEGLRALPKEYEMIDTKALLTEELQKGEKDIYYLDDSHWSWKASAKIVESMRFR